MQRSTAAAAMALAVAMTSGCSALHSPVTTTSASPTSTQAATTPAQRAAQSGLTQKLGAQPRAYIRGGAMVVASAGTGVPAGLLAASEKATAAVRGLDVHASKNPLLVVVPQNAAQYEAYTGTEPGNQLASTVTRAGALPFVVMSPWTVAHPDGLTTKETLAHEAFHALTLEHLAVDRPLWLLEGWAEYVGQKAVPQAPHRRDDMRPHLPADDELRGTGASDAYYVAFTFARYLRDRYGNDAVMAFYTDAVTTRTNLDALARTHFGASTAELERGYAAWYPTFR